MVIGVGGAGVVPSLMTVSSFMCWPSMEAVMGSVGAVASVPGPLSGDRVLEEAEEEEGVEAEADDEADADAAVLG